MESSKMNLLIISTSLATLSIVTLSVVLGLKVLKPDSDQPGPVESTVFEQWDQDPLAFTNLYMPINESRNTPLASSSSSSNVFDVVVVGGGISGLSASSTLCSNGVKVLLLEANNRLGGRIFSTYFGNMTIEIGAQWIVGAEQNPLISLLNLANVRRAKEYRTIVPKVLDTFINQSTCRDGNNTMPSHCISRGCTYDDVSLGALENLVSYLSSQLQGSNGLCIPTVKLNAKVTKIITNEQKSIILTEEGESFDASYVISTIPAGVLQTLPVFFEPPLPQPINRAIQNIDVRRTSVVYLSFATQLEQLNEAYYTVNTEASHGFDILNLQMYTGENVIATYADHDLSIFLEQKTDEETVEYILRAIQKHFGIQLSLVDHLVTHWGLHPNIRGSYTKPSICSKSFDIATLRQPINGRMIFAGEWVSSVAPGSLHGAFISGSEQAFKIVEALYENHDMTCDEAQECSDVVSNVTDTPFME